MSRLARRCGRGYPGKVASTTQDSTLARYKMAPLKSAMRALFLRLPRSELSYNLGKIVLRTVLRPAHIPEPVTVRFGNEFLVELDLGDFTSNDLYCLDAHYEATTLRLWRRLSEEAKSVVDIGSHIGIYALTAAEANPNARILAVEPHGGNSSLLRRHSVPYPNVEVVRAAVSSHRSWFSFCTDPSNSGGGYLSPSPGDDGPPIKTCALSELCAGRESVDLLKIDVEGHERTLLLEDGGFWESHRPEHIIVELRRDRSTRNADQELFSKMRRLGYSAQRIQGLYALSLPGSCDLANWHFYLTPERRKPG